MADKSLVKYFHQSVSDHILPLADGLGFNHKKDGIGKIELSSDFIVLTVAFDPYSFEIDTYLYFREFRSDVFDLRTILERFCNNNTFEFIFQASSPQRVAFCVKRVASYLEMCRDIIGDSSRQNYSKFKEAEQRVVAADKNMKVRHEMQQAWRDGDYRRYVQFSGDIEGALGKSEAAKIKYILNRK